MNFGGVCRFCNCTEENACRLAAGDTCAWYTRSRDVCTNPACIRAWHQQKQKQHAAAVAAGPKRRTPADIHALIQKERRDRRKKARKGRAA